METCSSAAGDMEVNSKGLSHETETGVMLLDFFVLGEEPLGFFNNFHMLL
jgi:hypothetical protein